LVETDRFPRISKLEGDEVVMNALRRVKGYFIALDSYYRLKTAISSSLARYVGDVVHVISQLSPNGYQGDFSE
jgi:hypothetical protein